MPAGKPRRFMLCNSRIVRADQLLAHPGQSSISVHAYKTGAHIIGEIIYTVSVRHKVTALALYEESLRIVPTQMPPLRGVVIGEMHNIQCSVPNCKNQVRWEMGKVALSVLLERYGIEDLKTKENPV